MKLRLVLAVLAIAMAGFAASHLSLRTDITKFMPDATGRAAGEVARRLTDSNLTRTMVLTVGARSPEAARRAAAGLAKRLEGHPEIAWLRSGIDADQGRVLYELYFPRRHHFLSSTPEHPETGVAALVSEPVLRSRAAELRGQLALPAGTFLEEVARADPLGGFTKLLLRARGGGQELQLEAGQFMSRDGAHAVLLLRTHASPFDTARQAGVLDALDAAFAAVAAAAPDDGLVLERSGVNRFAVGIEEDMQSDVWLIALVSFFGVAAVFLLFFRSPAVFGLAALPSLFGILGGATFGILWFGDLDALTLAFGASLIGVAIDYAIHLLNHHALSEHDEPATATARRLRPALVLGAGTTMASFTGLALTSFPGFREMGSFAIVGVGIALAFTLWVLPHLARDRATVPERSRRIARALERGVAGLAKRRRALFALPVAVAILAAGGLPRLHWNDDLSALATVDPDLIAEDVRVRERVSSFDTSRFVVVTAATEAEALARNDRVHAVLVDAAARGWIGGFRSLHDFVWAPDLQRRNVEALRAVPDLETRVDRAFQAEGFRAGAFAGFSAALDAGPPPLAIADLRASPANDLIESMAFDLGDQTAIVSYLRGVSDLAAVTAAVDAVPGARVFDQRVFMNEVYGAFRATTLRQIGIGSVLVLLVLALRYRRLRPTAAAFLPSVLTAVTVLALLGVFGVHANLLHVVSLVMVMGMGVDYGVFLVDAEHDPGSLGATMASLALSCITTWFVFGVLILSSHPALRAMGVTAALGIALSFAFAPATLVLLRRSPPA